MRMTRQIVLLLSLIIIIMSLVETSISFQQYKYVDSLSGFLINRSTPEDIVKSYYSLLDSKSFVSASELYSAEGQKIVNAEVLDRQAKSSKIVGTSLPTLFPSKSVSKYAAVAFVRPLKVTDSDERQLVLGVEFVEQDGFSNRWSMIGSLREIPEKYRLQLFSELMTLKVIDDPNKYWQQQYSEADVVSVKMQVQALVAACENAILAATNPSNNTKLDLVSVEKEFITKYAPYSTYIWSWKEQKKQDIPLGHPAG